MRLIVTSKTDIAGSNIYRALSRDYGFTNAGEFEGSPIFKKGNVLLIATRKNQVTAEHLDRHFTPEYYVFASRHRSVSEERTLTVHVPGNLTEEAKVGGRPREIACAAPDAMKTALIMLAKIRAEQGLDYKVSMEVTHHGPTDLMRPVLFVEVGSTEKEWNDPVAVDAVAKAALAAAENQTSYEKGIGIGGNHYAPRHTHFVLESKSALGHLIPSYALDSFDKWMFEMAVEKSGATFCFLDWKGMKRKERETVVEIAGTLGIAVRKSISNGEAGIPEGQNIFSVHAELFSLAERTDRAKLQEAISELDGTPIWKNGHLLPEIAAPADIRVGVLKACIDILKGKNPVLTGHVLVLEEVRFDPKKAVALGVKPGPDFAKLKNGSTLKTGNRIITSEDVMKTHKLKLHLDSETLSLLKSFI